MKSSKMFANGFWDGFNGQPCAVSLDSDYGRGYLEGAKLCGVFTKKEMMAHLKQF